MSRKRRSSRRDADTPIAGASAVEAEPFGRVGSDAESFEGDRVEEVGRWSGWPPGALRSPSPRGLPAGIRSSSPDIALRLDGGGSPGRADADGERGWGEDSDRHVDSKRVWCRAAHGQAGAG